MPKLQHSVKVPQLYKAASKIAKIVKEEGGSLKDLVFSYNKHLNIKGLYALIIKTFQYEDILDSLIRKSKIMIKEERADPWLIRILITELLFGRKCLTGESKPIKTVLSYRETLTAELEMAEKKGTFKLGSEQIKGRPRFVRVNTLVLTVNDALKYFRDEGWKLIPYNENDNYSTFLDKVSALSEDEFVQDFHIKELLIFPNKTEFYEHELYLNGSIILQDKASCLASKLLNPPPGSVTLDMCAAPGMKTTHLASLMKNKGTLYAVEMGQKRYQTLCNQVEKSGATCVKTLHCDALTLDSTQCPGVQYILVDPSCSGSGMVRRPNIDKGEKCSEARLVRLAAFQILLLRHALINFPDVKRVVYSTCSINTEENEEVIEQVLTLVNSNASNPVFKVVDSAFKDNWKHFGSENFEWGPKCLYAKADVDFTDGFFVAIFEKVEAGKDEMNVSEGAEKKKKRKKKKKHKEDSEIKEELSEVKKDYGSDIFYEDHNDTTETKANIVKKKSKKKEHKSNEFEEVESSDLTNIVESGEGNTEYNLDKWERNVNENYCLDEDSDKKYDDANTVKRKKNKKHKVSKSADFGDNDLNITENELQRDEDNRERNLEKQKNRNENNDYCLEKSFGKGNHNLYDMQEEKTKYNVDEKRRKVSVDNDIRIEEKPHKVKKSKKHKHANPEEEVMELETNEIQIMDDYNKKKSKTKKQRCTELNYSEVQTVEDSQIDKACDEEDAPKKKKRKHRKSSE
ncbi:28S rRNA (cytosine-C(5))-methyltransferase [Periplaneta americana]|uniref:28S rRNA (cytosine-C(5))-methyltransferase n=1 Tax=Periplaneta americana TaxID=6978 RepID=UPI0037E7E296